jgi:transketolase
MRSKINSSKKIKLDEKSIYLRKLILMCLKHEKRGHVGPAMSLVEILRVLYAKYIDKKKSKCRLSQGHGCLALYAVLFDNGFISRKALESVGKFNSILGGHPEHDKINGVEISTGALGHG